MTLKFKPLALCLALILTGSSLVLAQQARAGQSADAVAPVSTPTPTALVLPFENLTGRQELNWIGESFAIALTDLLRLGVNVVSNDERRIIQQGQGISLSSLPSLASSLKIAQKGGATVLVIGSYSVASAEGDSAMMLTVTAKVFDVAERRFLTEKKEGKKIAREIVMRETLSNLQTMHGDVAFTVLMLSTPSLGFSRNQVVDRATMEVPLSAFQAYAKGLAVSEDDYQTREAYLQIKEGYLRNALSEYTREKQQGVYYAAALELGHLYLEQRRLEEARDCFSRILDSYSRLKEGALSDSKNALRVRMAADFEAEAAFYMSVIYWRQANFDQALEVLKPLAANEEFQVTQIYNTIGAASAQASRTDKKEKADSEKLLAEALDYFDRALKSDPDNPFLLFNRGLALFLSGRYSEAAKSFEENVKLRERDGEGYFLLAKSLEMTQDPKVADRIAENDNVSKEYLRVDNRYAKLQTEWNRGKTIDTIFFRVLLPPRKDFVSAVLNKKNPSDEGRAMTPDQKRLKSAWTLYKKNQDDEALKLLQLTITRDPQNAEAYYLMGMIYYRQGKAKVDAALENLKSAQFWDNKFFDAYPPIVMIYLDRGNCLEAKNYFRLAQEVGRERYQEELDTLKRQVDKCSK